MNDDAAQLDAVLASLWQGLREVAAGRVDVVEAYVTGLRNGGDDDAARRDDAATAAHRLAGALGSYGRPGSHEAARL